MALLSCTRRSAGRLPRGPQTCWVPKPAFADFPSKMKLTDVDVFKKAN